MKSFTALVFVLACSVAKPGFSDQRRSNANRTGGLKGTEVYSKVISSGIFSDDFYFTDPIELNRFQGLNLAPLFGILPLEGGRERQGDFPSPINIFLWDSISHALAEGMAETCRTNQPKITFGPHRHEVNGYLFPGIQDLCSSATRTNLEFIWETVIGYEAPDEGQDWSEALMVDDHINSLLAQDRVTAVFYSLLMNPWFLLHN